MDTDDGFDPKTLLATLPESPGVYRMLDQAGKVIYVGKARKLRHRLSSYFTRTAPNAKTKAMVAQVHDVQITLTHTEAEALLLENNLIKELRPRYNVLLRDDKSYPYIYLSKQKHFPQLAFHRGPRRRPGRYFGPFPSAGAVRETLNHLKKVFPLRQCRDTFFNNRSRPCLQYQIKRCTAPCVGYITESAYAVDVRHVEMFFEGQSNQVIDELVQRMEGAAEALEYEEAARLRDRISALRRIQERQYVAGARGDIDVDVIACVGRAGLICIQVFMIRDGRNLGNQTFFPQIPEGTSEAEALYAFVARHYLGRAIPAKLLVSHDFEDRALLEEALARDAKHRVRIHWRVRGERRRWLQMAASNAGHALAAQIATRAGMERRFEELQLALDLDAMPERIECFDISHTQGEATVASCVVFNRAGALKSDYRRFNIAGIERGDDYAALRQALERRYTRLKRGEAAIPDILLIDGGRGQLKQAREVLQELQVEAVQLVGIAKGPRRRPGEETLFIAGRPGALQLAPDSPALHLLQQVRDEAHRFAITGHRAQRGRKRTTSVLEEIQGLGPKRRQTLLKQLGGLRGVQRAGVEDLARVAGISQALAERIYQSLHG
ncbi:MAG: excinuclease ABC subunit UvrC [Nitrococcus sp.]|nr:excinuclease ABC subunit UvrC [Nitrococcus sp.]